MAAAGRAAIAFDHRRFGDSGGEPRQLLSVECRLADWRAALRLARSRGDLGGECVGLWGTSFGGGHAIVTAAGVRGVRAAVAQVPHVDARASALGLRPLYVPIVAPEGRFAVPAPPGCWEGYTAPLPRGSRWRNPVAARAVLEVARYRPLRHVARVGCPLLPVAARRDTLIPLAAVEEAARRAPRAELEVVDGGHFDVYRPPLLHPLLRLETDFLARYLLGGRSAG